MISHNKYIFTTCLSLVFLFLSSNVVLAIEKISFGVGGVETDDESGCASISNNGLFIAFESFATNIILSDTNNSNDVFVYNRDTNLIERVSVGSLGDEGDGDSASQDCPDISGDGRYVVFSSFASNLVDDDTNSAWDIFVHDRLNGTTERVSVNSLGEEADSSSVDPNISGDGRYVVFSSFASNLVDDDTNSAWDIFVHDRLNGTTERVSVNSLGEEADSSSVDPNISGDGRYVVFSSFASNLVDDDTNSAWDIFVHDRLNGTTERVSVNSLGEEADNESEHHSVSDDGNIIVFGSKASNLVSDDINTTDDIFLKYRDTGEIKRLNLSAVVPVTNSGHFSPSISANGKFVSWQGTGLNLLTGDNSVAQTYVYDVENEFLDIASKNDDGEHAILNNVFPFSSFSEDGLFIVFSARSPNLILGDTNNMIDVFLKEINHFPTDINLSNNSINENEVSGTVIGFLSADDPNISNTHTYSFTCSIMSTGYEPLFDITGDTLVSIESFNYEIKNSYDICIRTDDGNGGVFDKNFIITITDQEETSGPTGSTGGSVSIIPPIIPPPPLPIPPEIPPLPPQVLPPETLPIPVEPTETSEPEETFFPSTSVEQPSSSERESQTQTIENFAGEVKSFFIKNIVSVDEFLQTLPEKVAKEIVDTVAVAGIILPVFVFVGTQPGAMASIPVQIWNIFPTLLGFKRKRRPWGTVYDSITKQPLDPVYVLLIDESGKEITSAITDLDGRYGFLVPPGKYRITVRKDNYKFPSKKMMNKTRDDLYDNLYFGEFLEFTKEDELIFRNIPMDAIDFNWNEFEKSENKKLMKFYSKRDLFFAKISRMTFYFGGFTSLLLLYYSTVLFNFIIIGIYIIVFILKMFGIKARKPGYIVEKGTEYPLSYGLVRIFSAALNKEVFKVSIGKTGKYYALIRNGEYYVRIFKKTGEDSYQEVFQSGNIKVRNGYIGNNFKV